MRPPRQCPNGIWPFLRGYRHDRCDQVHPRRPRGRGRARRDHLAGGAAREGIDIPHLCWLPEPGYRADGNCRACMVEIEGERVLAASCIRKPAAGMKVVTASERAQHRAQHGHGAAARRPAGARGRASSRIPGSGNGRSGWSVARLAAFPERELPTPDLSHPAMAVHLDACIHCNLCVRACREVQVNDVIGMAYRNAGAKIVFDMDDPMGASDLRRLRRMRPGLPDRRADAGLDRRRAGRGPPRDRPRGRRASAPTAASAARSPTTSRTTGSATSPAATARPTRTGCASRAASASTTSPTRDRLTRPLIRKDGRRRRSSTTRSTRPIRWTHFREASWEEALDRRRGGPARDPRSRRRPRARRLRLGQGLERGGLPVPEAGAHRLRLEQRRPLHAPVPRLLGRGAAREHRLGRGHRAVHRGHGRRRDRRDRRQPDREPSGRRDLLQAGRQARQDADRHGPARPGARSATPPTCCSSSPAATSRC